MYGNPWFYVALLAIFFIGVTKSGFGSGVGLIIVPLTALAMGNGAFPGRGADAALGLLLPLLVVGDLISVWQHRHYFRSPKDQPVQESTSDAPAGSGGGTAVLEQQSVTVNSRRVALQIMKMLVPGTVVGVLIGSLLLWWFHQQQDLVASLMKVEIGLESVLLVGLHWWRQYRGVQTRLLPEPLRSWLTGSFSGASSTLAHAAGPIIVMYLLPLKLERRLFVAVSALYFFFLNGLKLPFYYKAGQFAHAELSFTALFLPLVIAGAAFGFWVNRKMNDKLFTTFIYVCTFLLGWYVIYDGVISLIRR
jgi:uncharacterized membrane protein YfcA